MAKRQVTFQVTSEELYNEYKKMLIDEGIRPTTDLNIYIQKRMDEYNKKRNS